jgi:diaminohydroxyphosphoribosylaminopyrimidine deaminase/5-amino-6-(5-phosphoribosylamino)uracil reductase
VKRPGQPPIDLRHLRTALGLARRALGRTSPNPMVGAVLVKNGTVIGRGWHHRAGLPHAEIEALRDAERRGHNPRGATLHVTLEPCSTHGRTPPCTDAIIAAGIRTVIAGTTDPNPDHAGHGFQLLKRAGVQVISLPRRGDSPVARELSTQCRDLNETFNHWIVQRMPFVTVKAAMSLDGKIATVTGESKWITSPAARALAMNLRQAADAILVGVNTVIADNPRLTIRGRSNAPDGKLLRRIVLDSMARTPLTANVVADEFTSLTTIVVSARAPKSRVNALAARVNVIVAPPAKRLPNAEANNPNSGIPLRWLLRRLGQEQVTHLLVEGGGEVNASFLLGGFAQGIAFFYAPKILGGRAARKAVAGDGVKNLAQAIPLRDLKWRKIGPDLLLLARVGA